MSATDAGVQEGQVLAGKYRVDKVLGRGGMGIVVAAHHLHLDERVAIKFLLPEALTSTDAVARFIREARAAVRIKSEHVARVSDVGTLDNGAPYMVMEYLDGGDLGAWLDERGAMAAEQAAEFLLQACEAIGEAHALGIVHRDLKPANPFCVRRADGLLSVKVLDFGISKVTAPVRGSSHDHAMTRTNAVMGSPLYMSPEQMVSSRDVDARSDVWSLGVILYQLVTGRTPFEADGMPELVLKIAGSPPTPIHTFRRDLPPGFDAVVLRCLEKDRQRRFGNVAELATALLEFAPPRARGSVDRILRTLQTAGLAPPSSSDLRTQAVPHGTASSTGPNAAITGPTINAWGQTGAGQTTKRRTAPIAVGLGALALVLAGIGGFAARHGGARPLETAETAAMSAPSIAAPWPSANVAAVSAAVAHPPPVAVADPAPSAAPPPADPVAGSKAKPGASPAAASAISPVPHASKGVQAHAAAPPPAAPPAPAKNCNPPYVIDAAGHRQYKPECL
jgi:serine/threonine protein kinase